MTHAATLHPLSKSNAWDKDLGLNPITGTTWRFMVLNNTQ